MTNEDKNAVKPLQILQSEVEGYCDPESGICVIVPKPVGNSIEIKGVSDHSEEENTPISKPEAS